jgi:N6-L-threonylcarbamoyladenine synthase
LGIDSGTRHIGVSATTKKHELYAAEAHPRHDIVELLSTRREIRRTRRNRLRHREPRFDNRMSSKKEGWLPPSVMNNISFHLKIVDYVRRLLPITKITVEGAAFDTQKIKNGEIIGEEYQHGEQEGYENVRQYVLYRDRHTCQCCHGKSGDKVLHVHHLESRKTGGNSPGNLVTLCETCHDKVHANEVTLKIRRTKSMRDAAVMSVIKRRLYDEIRCHNSDIEVRHTFGYQTSHMRRLLRIEKSHVADARVISGNGKANAQDGMWVLTQVRRHNRQIHKANILKGGRLKRSQSMYCIKGYRLWDVVRHDGRLWFIKGKRSTGYFSLSGYGGNTDRNDSVSWKKLTLLCISNRLMVEYV